MERGLEEASVRGKNERQVKLVDTEKGFGSRFRSFFFYKLKSEALSTFCYLKVKPRFS